MKLLLIPLILFAAITSTPLKWPHEFQTPGKDKITVYQPQVESIENNLVTARSAFKLTQNGKDSFGSFVMKADTLINKDADTVTFKTIKVMDLQYPENTGKRNELISSLDKSLNETIKTTIPYHNLVASLDASSTEKNRSTPELRNEPPQIIFSTKPSLLIMVSGNPVLGPTSQSKEVERVMNTSALILHEKDKPFYLWALGKWFTAPEVTGPFTPGKSSPSSKFVLIKDDLIKAKTVDPLEGRTADGKTLYPPGVIPQVFVTTKPAELLQSSGDPKYSAVEKTGLLYMSNSPNSIFLEASSQNYYTLISGRWFSSKSLQGPWRFVNAKELPKDFAKIPVTSPVAEVLVSVPGTTQAKEAVIASSIPQTAQVSRSTKPKKITCDGSTKWSSVAGTSLQFAENCNTPLIKVNDKQFYVIQDGVWFSSPSATGPWEVAIAVPDQIYQIPPSSPIYYVTYVHIYGTSADYVIVGYTPGYHGTFVSADGTIVYGTGYTYPVYTSADAWYPPPSTYGFGVGYGWGYEAGFFMGFSMGAVMYPWGWGSCCWGPTYVNVNVTNVYHNWGEHSVITGPAGHGVAVNTIGNTKFARGLDNNTVYAGHDGSVYRRTGKGDWQKYSGPNTWDPVQAKGNINDLEKAHTARNPSMPRSGMRAGGGFHGGGGFRR